MSVSVLKSREKKRRKSYAFIVKKIQDNSPQVYRLTRDHSNMTNANNVQPSQKSRLLHEVFLFKTYIEHNHTLLSAFSKEDKLLIDNFSKLGTERQEIQIKALKSEIYRL